MELKQERVVKAKDIKCLVWDLDNTLWQGILLEGDDVVVRPQVREMIAQLDARGILQSIASRNDFAPAWNRLKTLQLDRFFLYPKIGWSDKSKAIRELSAQLNLSTNTFAFVDDQPFERDEVAFHLPEVRVFDITALPAALKRPEFTPRFVTEESQRRRQIYQADIARDADYADFDGARDDFLRQLNMEVTIRRATLDDLQRGEELTQRTNQLNSSGQTYSYTQLSDLLETPAYQLLVVSLKDRYGSSGTVGLVVLEAIQGGWLIRLFIMSCRVMNRGIGGIVLNRLLASMKAQGFRIQAEFVATERNRQAYILYRFNGFRECGSGDKDGAIRLEHDLSTDPPSHRYAKVIAPDLPI